MYANTYKVKYILGNNTKEALIAGNSKPTKGEAFAKISDPKFAMVPTEDITIESITEVSDR